MLADEGGPGRPRRPRSQATSRAVHPARNPRAPALGQHIQGGSGLALTVLVRGSAIMGKRKLNTKSRKVNYKSQISFPSSLMIESKSPKPELVCRRVPFIWLYLIWASDVEK